jgi:hypothetical protein
MRSGEVRDVLGAGVWYVEWLVDDGGSIGRRKRKTSGNSLKLGI